MGQIQRMTSIVPTLLLGFALLVLSLLHWYWAFGGTQGIEAALPTNDAGERVLSPGRLASAGVAVALLVAMALVLWRACPYTAGPRWLQRGGVWAVAAVFAARAIGDNRFVGFFKKVRDTPFARRDTLIFSPLCVVIALLACWLGMARP